MEDRARMEANRRHWDDCVPVHRDAEFYDLAGFKSGHSTLHSVELEELGDVGGRSLLHLQCHFGLDTLSWARLGARVTGVDFSQPAVELACSLAAELGIEARFVRSNLYDLPRVVADRFDVVFTSYGSLCWLPDLRAWARVVARFLRLGGTLLVVEEHPVAAACDEVDGHLEPVWPMFGEGPIEESVRRTYADPEARLPERTTYQWAWTVGEMVTALIEAGLRVERLREEPLAAWPRFPSMTRDADGWWRLPGDPLPLLVACRAVKPL